MYARFPGPCLAGMVPVKGNRALEPTVLEQLPWEPASNPISAALRLD